MIAVRALMIIGMALMMLAGQVQAEGVLAVAPLRLMLGSKTNSDVLSLTNRSDKTHTYKLVMQDQVMQADGNIVAQEGFGFSAKRMLRFMPRQVTLKPGERQNVRVMAMIPEGAAEGDYHTHLIFEQQKDVVEVSGTSVDKGLRIELGNLYSVGIPVIVQNGAMTGKLKLLEAKEVTTNGKTSVNVTLARTGNSEGSAMLIVVDRATGEKVSSPRNTHVYHEVDAVTVNVPVKAAGNLDVQLAREGQEPEIMAVTK
jgi:hypothetical protein